MTRGSSLFLYGRCELTFPVTKPSNIIQKSNETARERDCVEMSGLISTEFQKIFEDTFSSYGVTYVKERLQNVMFFSFIFTASVRGPFYVIITY